MSKSLDEILAILRYPTKGKWSRETIAEKLRQEKAVKIQALITEARIDELSRQLESSEYAEDRTATDIKGRIEATIEQLKENK